MQLFSRKNVTPIILLLVVGFVFYVLQNSDQKVDAEIALTIGEPWEEMRRRSSADIPAAVPGAAWFRTPLGIASLRLVDAEYGFKTLPAKFFTVGFNRESRIDVIHMSPQLEPLPLEEAIGNVLELQEQWRKGGWKPAFTEIDPPFVDTPTWREDLKNCKSSRAYWRADEKFQTQLNLDCFNDKKFPDTRYLISLELSRPY